MASNKQTNRCWPGYVPVPGKEEHEQGSCRPKPESQLKPDEKMVRAERRKELDQWQKEHPKAKRSAAQGHQPKTAAKAGKTQQNKTSSGSKKTGTKNTKAVAKKR